MHHPEHDLTDRQSARISKAPFGEPGKISAHRSTATTETVTQEFSETERIRGANSDCGTLGITLPLIEGALRPYMSISSVPM